MVSDFGSILSYRKVVLDDELNMFLKLVCGSNRFSLIVFGFRFLQLCYKKDRDR